MYTSSSKSLLLKELQKNAVKKYVNTIKIKRNECNSDSGSQHSVGSSKLNAQFKRNSKKYKSISRSLVQFKWSPYDSCLNILAN